MQSLIAIFLVSIVVGLVANWLTRRLAMTVGLMDGADGHRKLQSNAVPLGGGIAVFATTVAVLAMLAVLDHRWWTLLANSPREKLGLLTGALLIVLIGVLDDFRGIRGRQKLLGQIIVATVIASTGTLIERIALFGWVIDLQWFAYPFTLFWLLGAINALNLLDGIDGLVGSIGVILIACVSAMAAVSGHLDVAIIGVIVVGALLGFLRYNFPPASMYLGDAGSMLIGLLIGAMAIQASLKSAGTVLLAAPLAMLAIPIFDSSAAILRRKLSGRSIFSTDRGHLHHLLTQRVGNRRALMLVTLACAFTAGGALLSAYWQNDFIALVVVFALVGVFVVARVFGHSELLLLLARMRGFGRSFAFTNGRSRSKHWETQVHMQGSREWQLLWATLTEWAEKLSLCSIRLDVNAPTLHECYHATWQSNDKNERDRCWEIRMPLIVGEQLVGCLDITGACEVASASQNIERLMDLMEPFEQRLRDLTAVSDGSDNTIHEPSPHVSFGDLESSGSSTVSANSSRS